MDSDSSVMNRVEQDDADKLPSSKHSKSGISGNGSSLGVVHEKPAETYRAN